MAVLSAVVVFAGFGPSFYLRSHFESSQLPPLVIGIDPPVLSLTPPQTIPDLSSATRQLRSITTAKQFARLIFADYLAATYLSRLENHANRENLVRTNRNFESVYILGHNRFLIPFECIRGHELVYRQQRRMDRNSTWLAAQIEESQNRSFAVFRRLPRIEEEIGIIDREKTGLTSIERPRQIESLVL